MKTFLKVNSSRGKYEGLNNFFKEREMTVYAVLLLIVFFYGCVSQTGPGTRSKYTSRQYSPYGSMEEAVSDLGDEVAHLVVKGDTLHKIARKYEVTVDEIIRENRIKGDRIVVGELLIIPNTRVEREDSFSKIFDFTEEMTTYLVQKGDTLGKIARRYNSTVKRIAEINNIKNRNRIKIGQKLLIPKN